VRAKQFQRDILDDSIASRGRTVRNDKQAIRLVLAVAILLCLLSVLAGPSICEGEAVGATAKRPADPYVEGDLTIRIISSVNGTFGYDILLQGRPFVHQPSIPALPGNEGFTTREGAQSVAELVVKKIRGGEIPPTVTVEELNALDVLK